jgi:glyoxylase-like metal-dependent hydrolase (beta-lactamase superfamily II)
VSSKEGSLELTCQEVGPWGTNAYSLSCRTSGQSVLIGPAGEPETLLAMLDGSEPARILITHSHMDHMGALPESREALGAPVLAHRKATGLKADRWVDEGDLVHVGEQTREPWRGRPTKGASPQGRRIAGPRGNDWQPPLDGVSDVEPRRAPYCPI